VWVNAVLGLSVTPSGVGVVLVEGHDDDRVTLDGERFEVRRRGSATAAETSAQAAAAVLRTEAVAADLGRRVHSIGVTWSDDAGTEASLLLTSLRESGYDNIVPVRLSEATDALARRIALVLGYRTTAVCVIEPEQLIALVVSVEDAADGTSEAVQTAVNHSVVTEDDLVGWLSTVFTRADWEPEALVLVGSGEDLEDLLPVLEDALAVPVFSPAEAALALARGAALACAQPGEFAAWEHTTRQPVTPHATRRRRRRWPQALLAAGAITFVASASAAVALQLTPEPIASPPRSAAESPVRQPAAPSPVPPAPVAPAPDPAPEPVAPAAEDVPVEAPPAPQELPEQVSPDVLPPATAPVEAVPPPPPVEPAPAVIPAPVPAERPGILDRIRDRLSRVGDPVVEMPPPPVPGAPVAPVPPPLP